MAVKYDPIVHIPSLSHVPELMIDPVVYFVVLACSVAGLIAMMVGNATKSYLALAAFVVWLFIFMFYYQDYPLETAGSGLRALISAGEMTVFLIPVMTVIEGGIHFGMMNAILRHINTRSMLALMIIIGVMSYVLSAVLDNIAATIVMGALLSQLVYKTENKVRFACIIIAGANAGGVPSAIGNTTSILLWVGGQLTIEAMFLGLILPSLAYLGIVLLVHSRKMKGEVERPIPDELDMEKLDMDEEDSLDLPASVQWFLLGLVLFCIGLMIVAKLVWHLPPWMGAFGSLGVWGLATHYLVNKPRGKRFMMERDVRSALQHIDKATIVMFMLMLTIATGASEVGLLDDLAALIDSSVSSIENPDYRWLTVATIFGFLSSTISNTLLVAITQLIYTVEQNHLFWLALNYTTGLGGTLLLIGTAPGIVLSSMLNGSLTIGTCFKESFVANLLGFFAGLAVLILMHVVF